MTGAGAEPVTGGDRHLLFVIGTAPKDGATVAALRLAEVAARRGSQVSVYAYGDAVRVAADGCPTGGYVRGLLTASAAGAAGSVRWVVDGADPRTTSQVDGVDVGDGSDLWELVRDADVVLGVTA